MDKFFFDSFSRPFHKGYSQIHPFFRPHFPQIHPQPVPPHRARVDGTSGHCIHATEQKISPAIQVDLFGSAAIVRKCG